MLIKKCESLNECGFISVITSTTEVMFFNFFQSGLLSWLVPMSEYILMW